MRRAALLYGSRPGTQNISIKELFHGVETHQLDPVVIPAPQHRISQSRLSPGALAVLDRLQEAGFETQLVGGCVRDLLLDCEPKDYDIATDARPEQVKQVFRRARLIGRRFRLAHVRVGREVIEVATYRSDPNAEHDDAPLAGRTAGGRLLSDNVFGTRADDALRRDFTVNGLYYDHRSDTLVDYVGGFSDAQRRLLRAIGEPAHRYREDPVRMLRALRFAAKLDFEIDGPTATPIGELGPLLADVPPARMFDEVLKLFHHGRALPTYELLREYGVFSHLFPDTARLIDGGRHEYAEPLLRRALANTDARVVEGKPVIPAFLFAVVLWAPLRQRLRRYAERGEDGPEALQAAAAEVIERQCARIAIPRRVATPVKEIWAMQATLERRPRRAARLLENKRFRAAYDFLLLRAQAGDADAKVAEWWTQYQHTREMRHRPSTKPFPRGGRSTRGRHRRREVALA